MDNKLDQLKDLAALKEQGVLTDAEFEVQKAKILAG
jgi:Short C-terminal domain